MCASPYQRQKAVLSKAFYRALPVPIADKVREWAATYRKRHVSVSLCSRIYIQEDAEYTAFSADCTAQRTARAAGEWAGASGLRPSAECVIPPGCTLIEAGIFCGVPHLTIHHNDALRMPDLRVDDGLTGGRLALAESGTARSGEAQVA